MFYSIHFPLLSIIHRTLPTKSKFFEKEPIGMPKKLTHIASSKSPI
jgi:hypothetical protein